MHLTDSHAHLDMYPAEELPGVLARACDDGVRTVLAIGIGDGPDTMHRALYLAEATQANATPRIFASAGIHPQEAHQASAVTLGHLAALATRPRCIAIGEIGLDYYHADNPDIATQKAAFVAQMHVAAHARKPILIHCRTSELATVEARTRYGDGDAWDDLLALVEQHWTPHRLGGIIHCFSGNIEHARRSLDLGFHLSFAGNLTYPKAVAIRDAASFAPPDRILIETDAPFLAPVPHRGQRNEPAMVAHTALELARLRHLPVEQLAELTTRNFEALFPSTVEP